MLNLALRKMVAATGVTVSLLGALPETASAAWQNFRVHNRTGRTMVRLWVSESDSTRWGDNVLSRTLPNGYNTMVVFPYGSSDCLFDIAARFNDGSTSENYDVNLCRVADYTFYP